MRRKRPPPGNAKNFLFYFRSGGSEGLPQDPREFESGHPAIIIWGEQQHCHLSKSDSGRSLDEHHDGQAQQHSIKVNYAKS